MDDELSEIKQATHAVLAAVFAAADRVEPPENARAMVLGIASVMIAESMKHGEEAGADEMNRIWKERGFPWRMEPVQ